jgi:hypothetical protein
MQKQFTAPITYFLQEGKSNLEHCLKIAFESAKQQSVNKIVVFTAIGDGIRVALETFCGLPDFAHIRLVAVTFPVGQAFTDAEGKAIHVDISAENTLLMKKHEIPVIKAHLPFDPIATFHQRGGVLGQDMSLVGEALSMFGGSMSLCVQAILMACDAGAIGLGEHVIAVTSDTAILAQASCTSRMLRELVIREILCKPAVLSIGRGEISEKVPLQMELPGPAEQKALPTQGGESEPPENS